MVKCILEGFTYGTLEARLTMLEGVFGNAKVKSVCGKVSIEVTVFLDEYEAQEYVSEVIQHRLDHIVQHSPVSVSESEYEALQEQESALFRIDEESI